MSAKSQIRSLLVEVALCMFDWALFLFWTIVVVQYDGGVELLASRGDEKKTNKSMTKI
jgi:hypothetical protein